MTPSLPSLLILVGAATALVGCQSTAALRVADDHSLAATPTQGALRGRPTLSLPTQIPGRDTCLIPFSLEDRKGWFESNDAFARGGFSYRGDAPASSFAYYPASTWGSSVRWHNAIIHDLTTNEEWTILPSRGVIGRWAAFAPPALATPGQPAPEPVCAALLFIATTEDTNRDGVLNDLDANIAIVTQGDGRSPRAVSPPNAQVWSTSYDAKHNRIYLLVVTDTNHDGKFDNEDAPLPYALNLDTREAAIPLLSGATRDGVERLLK